jgi:hypothetical protein
MPYRSAETQSQKPQGLARRALCALGFHRWERHDYFDTTGDDQARVRALPIPRVWHCTAECACGARMESSPVLEYPPHD